ncbi:hypothetical protein [Pseudomonas sp.]|uniref:hypothetical protein n=1 Tax=Pseudomonas sp. TaxID=306 RepID=UPI003CC5B532
MFRTFSHAALIAAALALAAPAMAQTHSHASKHSAPAKKPASGPKVTMLKGRFSFTLPPGYVASAMDAGDEQSGTSGAKGTMYQSEKEKRVVMASEGPTPDQAKVGDYDAAFLDAAVQDFVKQQSAGLTDFKKTGEKEFTVKGLGVREIDSTATQGGGPTLSTTFLAGSGSSMSIVQVISRADDQKGHEALVKRIASGK